MKEEILELQKHWEKHKERTNETQVTAAAKLNIKQATFSLYLSGKLKLNSLFILKMCRMMGVNPSRIRPSMASIFGDKKGKRLLDQIDGVIDALKG